MSDGVSDDAEDVVGVLTDRIESRYGMRMDQLRAAVAAAPSARPDVAGAVRWHGLLTEAQAVLDRAEDDLLAALETQPGESGGPVTDLARRVTEAVTVRDGRALVVRWLLDPEAGGKDLAARLRAALRPPSGPAVQTSPPRRPAGPPAAHRADRAGGLVR
ncbi:hypothetical protein [Streptomyces acidiscabies]|uniref:Uncharacterized protein n=2 Tax=Streptomyces acidiscabies TaxID=42234 RepID=A0AAP6BJI3_9ACTN|nr:hypothetical protein [Streptomyces acidiscabies]MBZ3916745.1 hypothetical protein [Streptomyces acidiscabies]MDX2965617.1 hypothetical protein [Streptomyces acidiscabies]MDX3024881.1 hypothetical protein [Streptomyces acidiscabies]MDX3795533.1 hypothetical protein [Streptomyces acidiscabies]